VRLPIAEEGPYSIGLIEANIGLLPAGGGTQRLSRLIGPSRNFILIASGQALSPNEAACWASSTKSFPMRSERR
jgi:enoyl-CoA hydratase/carnithine racemase